MELRCVGRRHRRQGRIIVESATDNPVSDDEEMLTMLDRQMDDGNLETGNVQVGSTFSVVYIIEK
jgi:hypothetical protein